MNNTDKTKTSLPYNTHVYHYCGTIGNNTIDGILHLRKCVTNMSDYHEVKKVILRDMVDIENAPSFSITSMSYLGQHLVFSMDGGV